MVIKDALAQVLTALNEATQQRGREPRHRPVGTVLTIGDGVARIAGLDRTKTGEILLLEGGVRAMAHDLDPDSIGAVLLDEAPGIRAGASVVATGEVARTPVGPSLLGRVIDPLGRPMDDEGPINAEVFYPIERPAAPIIHRAPVTVPLQTGVKIVDAFVPIGRGQRELILGDRQTGKTAIALDAIANQADTGVLCIYVAIGQRTAEAARVVHTLKERGALDYTVVVVAGGEQPPGLQYIAPYAGMSIGEAFMEQGKDVLIVFDDLTKHAYAYRELSLILRRPPGREAFPSDIFYAHSRLLERSTHLRPEMGGGSLTALPIAETQAQNISAYVPTNLISITDGQVYLDADLFHRNIRPAVDVGRSVSRVGGKSQLPAFRKVVANLKLAYSQFEELELFARLGTRLDPVSEQVIRRGREIREVFKQTPFDAVSVGEQVALLVAVTEGLFAPLPIERIGEAERRMRQRMRTDGKELAAPIEAGEPLTDEGRQRIIALLSEVVEDMGVAVSASSNEGAE